MDTGTERNILKKAIAIFLWERQEKYRSIKHHGFRFPVGEMRKMYKVSKRGYYNWLGRGPSKRWSENKAITAAVRNIFKESFESYSPQGSGRSF